MKLLKTCSYKSSIDLYIELITQYTTVGYKQRMKSYTSGTRIIEYNYFNSM